ncbi:MAG: hypothetical protein ACJ76Z_13515 [Thermoleophilaceae bacterium]
MTGPRKEPSLILRIGGSAVAVLVAAAVLAAPAGAASLQLPKNVGVTVVQGQSAAFTIPVAAGGAFTCSSQASVAIDGLYMVNSRGEAGSGDPSGTVVFSGINPRGNGNNCDVTWPDAPAPYAFPATATAAGDTAVGDYTTRIGYTVQNIASRGPSGKLSNAGVAEVTIHVVASQPLAEPPVQIPAVAQEVLGVRVAALRPKLGETVLLAHVTGAVRYKTPQGRVHALGKPVLVPMGTTVDVVKGVVKVTVERDAAGDLDSVDAWGGSFIVVQPKGDLPVTTFTLTGTITTAQKKKAAHAARKRRGSSKVKLWMNGKGNFKTKGKRASAVVLGTYWLTEETAGGTAVVVKRGVVGVRDFTLRKTVVVTAGHSYLARIRARLAAPRFTG